jgi:hypothetical protein
MNAAKIIDPANIEAKYALMTLVLAAFKIDLILVFIESQKVWDSIIAK